MDFDCKFPLSVESVQFLVHKTLSKDRFRLISLQKALDIQTIGGAAAINNNNNNNNNNNKRIKNDQED